MQMTESEYIEKYLSERKIESLTNIWVKNNSVSIYKDGAENDCAIQANGVQETLDPIISVKYSGDYNSYRCRIHFPNNKTSFNGITLRYKVNGWEEINYIAIGADLNTNSKLLEFKHVKIKHVVQNEWTIFTIGFNDLVYLIDSQNMPLSKDVIDNIYIYIVAKPGSSAELHLEDISIWLESLESQCGKLEEITKNSKAFDTTVAYLKKLYPEYEQNAIKYYQTGMFPCSCSKYIEWNSKLTYPYSLHESNTYTYNWHALKLPVYLMLYWTSNKNPSFLLPACNQIDSWLEINIFNGISPGKYIWYDHGVAERCISLLLLLVIGGDNKFDYRQRCRLEAALIMHAQLLENEAFYSVHQPTRYHNHAWFQDIALLMVSSIFPTYSAALRWRSVALNRLHTQLKELVTIEDRFCIFNENSIGYHKGMQTILELIIKLTDDNFLNEVFGKYLKGFNNWSEYFRYCDGSHPANGDTFRIANINTKSQNKNPDHGCSILSKSGYGIVKGTHRNKDYILTLLASSLSATHKHEDNLSLTLYYDNVEWLIDPSYYSHDKSDPKSNFLFSAQAHNAISIPSHTYSLTPGKASITGHVNNSKYTIYGTHRCYDDIIIQRTVKGSTDNINITISDRVEHISKISNGEAFLNFHLGDDVYCEYTSEYYQLSHPESAQKLCIHVNTKESKVIDGWNSNTNTGSIAARGFMESNDTTSIQLPLSIPSTTTWSISTQ
jgi:hypothetical protein